MAQWVPSPLPEYLQFLSVFGPEIGELALATRKLVLEEAPGAIELIYDAYNALASGYCYTGRTSECFIHIAVYAGWVNLGFNRGTELPDPAGMLKGSGKSVRHVRITKTGDLKNPALRELVRAAVAAGERPEKPLKATSVVKAIYPKRRRPVATR